MEIKYKNIIQQSLDKPIENKKFHWIWNKLMMITTKKNVSLSTKKRFKYLLRVQETFYRYSTLIQNSLKLNKIIFIFNKK